MEMKMTALCQAMPIEWLEAICQPRYRQAYSLLGLLMTPIAVAAGAVAAWRFGADAGWTRSFFIAHGVLSNWQVWAAFAIGAEAGAYLLSRVAPAGVQVTA